MNSSATDGGRSTANVGARPSVAVIIPCYRVRDKLLGVLEAVGPVCDRIYVVDDACPEGSGRYAEAHSKDPRLHFIYQQSNTGVGGAVMAGYRQALGDGATILVKLDGDGQMDPRLIPRLIGPIVIGVADYSKGNRFFDLSRVGQMPALRLIGNAGLSFLSKLSSGYWDIFDPTNGFTAAHASAIASLPLDRVDQRYFFESDMLFRLGLARAVVQDIPMHAFYADEKSSLRVGPALFRFAWMHGKNLLKRIFYRYYLHDFSIAGIELALGGLLLAFGVVFGGVNWVEAHRAAVGAASGTIMLAALPVILGTNLLLAFLSYDIRQVPRTPLQKLMEYNQA